MATVNIHDAKTHLSALLKRVANGEDVVIAKAGQPIARLIKVSSTRGRRVLGCARGQVWMAPDFDELPESELKSFEEGAIDP